jgi:alanyl-tRNA synthetase
MSERIYYKEPSVREFDAVVVADDPIDLKPAVVLDRTAFYPTSGGQPFDAGTLNEVRVLDVFEGEDGDVRHVLERPIAKGVSVHGVIDWDRRFDHMQQHTGQHVLSASFDHLFGARTVGFHLGAVVSTVDLSKELTAEAVARAEDDANRIVWEDRPVAIRFATEEEAASMPLRKEPERSGLLRLIDIDGFDLSACGGTHVARTGEVGNIHVLSSERLRGGLRIEFACGGRALRRFRRLRDAVSGCIRNLSVLPEELAEAIERLQAENKELRRAQRGMQERLASYEAASLADRAVQAGERFVVVESLPGWDTNGLKALCVAIASRPGYDAALFSDDAPFLVAIGCSQGAARDAPTVLRMLTSKFGGKGGGRGDLAQGGGLNAAKEEILAEARRLLG